MKQYIDKSALVAEIERRIDEVNQIDKASYEVGLFDAYKIILSFLDTLEVKEINNVWHDTRRTIPEDGSEQIICIKEDGLAVSTVGKIVNGTIIWAYLGDLLYTNSFNVEVKEVQEEPVSNDIEAEFVLYLKHKFNIPQEGNTLKTDGWRPSPYDILDIAKHFAQWQKERILNNAGR